MQPAIIYRKWAKDSKQIEYLEEEIETHLEAIKVAKEKYKFTLGVFYRTQRPTNRYVDIIIQLKKDYLRKLE